MSFGDAITYICLAIALWYVPRYLLRVYAPGLYARIKLSIESAVRDLQARDYARYLEKQAMRQSVSEPTANQRFRSGSGVVVLEQQNQEFQNQNVNFETIKTFLTEHNLSDEQVVILLALIRRSNGDDLLSANKIRDIAGGADGVVKPLVAAHRRPRPKVSSHIKRSANGW